MGYFLIPDKAFSKIVASLTTNLQSQLARDELVEFVSQCSEISDQEKKDFMQGRGNYHLDKSAEKTNGLSMHPAAVRQRELRAKKSAKTRAKKIAPAPASVPSDSLTVQQF